MYNEKEKFLDKEKKFEKDVKNTEMLIETSIKYPIAGNAGGSLKHGPDTTGLLNISADKNVPLYKRKAVELSNIKDKKISNYSNGRLRNWQSYMEDKIQKQFKDFNFKTENIKGHIFKADSAQVARIKKSQDFKI